MAAKNKRRAILDFQDNFAAHVAVNPRAGGRAKKCIDHRKGGKHAQAQSRCAEPRHWLASRSMGRLILSSIDGSK